MKTKLFSTTFVRIGASGQQHAFCGSDG